MVSTAPNLKMLLLKSITIFSSCAGVGHHLNPNRQDFAGLFVFKTPARLFFPRKQKAFILDDNNKC